MSVSLCRILVIPPDRRRLVTVPQSRTTGCQWSDARSVVELVKVVAGGAGLLNLETCQNPNLPTARTPFSPHETTAGLTDREGSWHYRSVSPFWEPLSARLFLVAGGAGGGSASASATSATSDNTIQCDGGTIS